MKIFISHSHQDMEVCRKLADALMKRGYEVFADSAIDFGQVSLQLSKQN